MTLAQAVRRGPGYLKGSDMTKFITRFAKDESGATAIEYGLIAALIGIALAAALKILGPQIGNTLNNVGNELK